MSRPVNFWFTLLVASLVATISSLANASDSVGKADLSFPACQLCRLDATPADAASIEWDVTNDDVEVFRGQKSRDIVVWVPSPRRLLILKRVTDKAGKQSTEVLDIRVTGESPKPNPKPVQPDVKPRPDAPPLSPFALKVFDEACKVNDHDRAKHAKAIAAGLKSVRSKIVAKAIDTSKPSNVVREIAEQTGTQPAAWRDWVTWWNENAKAVWTSCGKMTPENWLYILDATIEGLDAVK